MQREGSCVGPVVQKPLDALLILIVFTVRTSGKDVIDLHGEENKTFGYRAVQVCCSEGYYNVIFVHILDIWPSFLTILFRVDGGKKVSLSSMRKKSVLLLSKEAVK